MDVQAEGAGLTYDPSVTSAVGRAPAEQGTFFTESPSYFTEGSSYRTFADTDQIPAVRSDRAARRAARRPGRWLAVLVGMLALMVALAGAALGLVQAGVIGNTSPGHATAASGTTRSSPPAGSQRATAGQRDQAPHKAGLLTQTSTGAGAMSYRVSVPAYGLTITTTTGRAWVSVGTQGQPPLFAGIINADSKQHFTILGSTQVEVGAGGTSVTVTSNKHSQTLFPPSAPFNYTLTTS
jgi:hypothetical protein